MARNIRSIADTLGAKVVGQVPETSGGVLGSARLAQIVAALRERVKSENDRLPGGGRSDDVRLDYPDTGAR